jgi:peptidoglycan/xylan/chitin deacetylase (PgdA/CDA1 family)
MDLKKSKTRRLSFLVISLAFCCLETCLKKLKAALGKEIDGTCVVLCYHSVPRDRINRFRSQMAILNRTAKPIAADFRGVLGNATRHVILTFDDGYSSVIENALPVLNAYKIKSTLFLIPAKMGIHPDWISTDNHPDLKEITVRPETITSIPVDLFSFGSHGLTHANLTQLDELAAEAELVESKAVLENITHTPISVLAFPYGYFNPQLVEKARSAGYRRVFTLEPALALTYPDEFCCGRFEICLDYWDIEFKLILLGAYRWLPAASRLLRQLLRRS